MAAILNFLFCDHIKKMGLIVAVVTKPCISIFGENEFVHQVVDTDAEFVLTKHCKPIRVNKPNYLLITEPRISILVKISFFIKYCSKSY